MRLEALLKSGRLGLIIPRRGRRRSRRLRVYRTLLL